MIFLYTTEKTFRTKYTPTSYKDTGYIDKQLNVTLIHFTQIQVT